MSYEIGDKVKYKTDKGGWKVGTVFAIRHYDFKKEYFTNDGVKLSSISYLIDTGNDVRVDEVVHDPRVEKINELITKEVEKTKARDPKKIGEIVHAVHTRTDLPESKITIEKIRQPEQVEVTPDHIKPA